MDLEEQFSGAKDKDSRKDHKTESRSSADQNEKDPETKDFFNHDKYTSVEKFQKYFEFFKTLKRTQGPTQQKLSSNKESIFHQLIDSFFNQKSYEIDEKIKECSSLDLTTATVLSKLQSKFQSQVQKHILKSQRFKKSNLFTKKLKIHEIRSSKSSKTIQIELQLLWYKVEITILNEMAEILPFKPNQISDSGSFGSIYFTKIFDEFLAVKSIPIEKVTHINKSEMEDISKLKTNSKIFIKTLKEFFFVLLFSDLRIGPQAKTVGGFDMVMYQGSILFATQICSEFRSNNKIDDLKPSLFCMHMMQIVHRDIKPENFMYSETYKKNVFIDFGCAQVLEAKIGEKSMTHFAGTTMFCSEEVLLLLKDNKKAVDLYFNDMFGLEKCAKESSVEKKQSNFNFIKNYKTELLSLKFDLFSEDDEVFLQKWRIIIREYPESFEEIERQVLQFFRNTKPRYLLRRFYDQQISDHTKAQPEFQDLQRLMKGENSLKLYYLKSQKRKEETEMNLSLLLKLIEIQLGTLTDKEKEVSLKLLHKTTAQKVIFELMAKLQKNNVQNLDSEDEDIVILCSMVMRYCSLYDNYYKASKDQKVKICQKTLEIITKTHSKLIQKNPIEYRCPIVQLEPICLFSQFFLIYVCPHIVFEIKSQLIIKAVGNLCLLGVPMFQKWQQKQQGINYFINKVIFSNHVSDKYKNQHNTQKKQIQDIRKIVLFWEFRNCIFMLKDIFYVQRKLFIKINEQNENLEKIIAQNQDFIALQRDKNKEFFSTNYKLYAIICNENKTQLNDKQFEELFQLIRSIEIPQDQQLSKLIIRWKKTLCVSICSLIMYGGIYKASQILKLFEQERVLDYFFGRRLLEPQLLLVYWDKINNSRENISIILREIDERVGQKKISLRLQINTRLRLALNYRDFQTLKDIVQLISRQIKPHHRNFFISNTSWMYLLTNEIIYFLKQSRKASTVDEQLYQILNSCQSLLSIAMEFGIICIMNDILDTEQFKNLMNQKMKNIHFASCINYCELKNLLFHNLEAIGILYQKFYTKVKFENHQFIKQQNPNSFRQTSQKLEKIKFPVKWYQKYQEFIIKLHSSEINTNLFSWFIKNFYSLEQHKIFIKENSQLSTLLASSLIQYRQSQKQINKCHQIIKEIFGQLSQNRLIEFTSQLKERNFQIAFNSIKLELLITNYDTFWCQQFITLFEICKNKDLCYLFFKQFKSIHILFICFVCTKKSFEVMKELFVYFSLFLRKHPIQSARDLQCIFQCKCQKCVLYFPKKQNHYGFTQFLYERIKEQKAHDNPYMALVYFSCISTKYFPKQMSQAFFMYILRSMSYLTLSAKQIILTGLHGHVYSMYEGKAKVKNQFLSVGDSETTGSLVKFLINKNTDSMFQSERGSSFPSNKQDLRKKFKLKIKKSEMNDKNNRKFIYCYNQTLKHQDPELDSLEEIVSRRFFREDIINKYIYPQLIKKMYSKKLQRYYLVKENYNS